MEQLDRQRFAMLEAEGQRYASFFGALPMAEPQVIARATALEFFAKSSLPAPAIEQLYGLLKHAQIHADPMTVSETEFIVAMHLIVCMTKRGLPVLPATLPTYLFPTLNLPAPTGPESAGASLATAFAGLSVSHGDLISSMPSPEKPAPTHTPAHCATTTTELPLPLETPTTPTMPGDSQIVGTSEGKLHESTSLLELLHKEVQAKRQETTALANLDRSETKVLENLHASLEMIATAVEELGFPVPPTAKTLGALDDFSNLLRKHTQSLRQEIQTMEISAQMLSAADEATAPALRTNSGSLASSVLGEISKLTQQLASLQQESARLLAKRMELARRVRERHATADTNNALVAPSPPSSASLAAAQPSSAPGSSTSATSGVSGWGEFGSTTDMPVKSPAVSDVGGFGAPSEPSPQPAATGGDDFGWGAF